MILKCFWYFVCSMLVSTMSCIQGAIMELGVFGCSGMMVFETLWVISHKPVTDISLLPFYFNHRFSIRFQSGNFSNHFRPLSGCFFMWKPPNGLVSPHLLARKLLIHHKSVYPDFIFLPFSIWGSYFQLLTISKQKELEKCVWWQMIGNSM